MIHLHSCTTSYPSFGEEDPVLSQVAQCPMPHCWLNNIMTSLKFNSHIDMHAIEPADKEADQEDEGSDSSVREGGPIP